MGSGQREHMSGRAGRRASRGASMQHFVGKNPELAASEARSLWAANAAIREEFLDEAGFIGYAKAVAAGRVKIVGGEL